MVGKIKRRQRNSKKKKTLEESEMDRLWNLIIYRIKIIKDQKKMYK